MTKLLLVQLLSLTPNYLTSGLLLMTFVMGVHPTFNRNTVLLNSCKRCKAGLEYKITSDEGYHVTVSPSAHIECHWECVANISSAKEGGWLCLVQVGIMSRINDTNGELFIYDNQSSKNSFKNLNYFPSNFWPEREVCRKTNFMKFNLMNIDAKYKLDFSKVHIQLKVLDIGSTERKVYLDSTYCRTTYKLLNSQVRIYNQPAKQDYVSYDQVLTPLCGIPFEMIERTANKSICLLYIPSDDVNCRSNWKFSVSVAGHSLKPSDMVYTLRCSDEKASQEHTWCASNDTQSVTVIFQRDKNVTKSLEHPHMFQYIILDYAGSAESLMMEKDILIKELHKLPDDSSGTNYWYIVVGILALLIVILVAVLVYYSRRRFSCIRYGSVHNPVNATSV